MPSVHESVLAARAGTNPALVCRVPSGWVVMCVMQFLPGYCILQPDPVVESINALDRTKRAEFLVDMATVGDALMEVTGSFRINYGIMGNSDPALHAHIVPRYLWEEERLRKGLPWTYPQEVMDSQLFDPIRDQSLMDALACAITKRI